MKKAETDQKYEETYLKFEETNQKMRSLKFLKKAGTDQKYEETPQNLNLEGFPKILRNRGNTSKKNNF